MSQSFGPLPYGMLSPAAMAGMGVGSGGFNPTPMEYLAGQVRNQYQQRFMAEALRSDPRAQNITTALLNQMSASSQKSTLNVFGGRANLQEMVGMALSMPGISSVAGGSPYSLAQGSLAAATGGMKIGGVGMFAEGAAGMMGAHQIVQHMTRQFYFRGGGANTMATSGLNRDQIGGIMSLGAAQGAFAGLNMGSIVPQGNKLVLAMDPGTLAKIDSFTRSAAKAVASVADVYGNDSIGNQMARIQQITGLNLSQLGNADLMQQRLSALRQTGLATGIDTGTMFDLSAMGVRMGGQMGLRGNFAGNVGVNTASMAAEIFRANQGQAGSFRTATTSIQEIQAGLVRDVAGMSRDPIGRRRMALQMGLETGHFTGSAADEARRLIREDGPGTIGRIDAFMGSKGISTRAYIDLMGGPEGMMNLMSEGGMDTIREGFMDTVGSRARTTFRNKARRAFGSRVDSAGGLAMMESIEGVGKETLDKIFQATKSGFNESEVSELLQGDPAGRLNSKKYLNTIRTAVSGLGGNEAAALHASMQQAISNDTFLSKHFMSASGRESMARNRLAVQSFSVEERGQMTPGLIEGFLNKMSGSDPRTSFVRAAMLYPNSLIGSGGGITLPTIGQPMAEDVARKTANTLIMGLGKTDEGKEALRELGLLGKDAMNMTLPELSAMNAKLASDTGKMKAFKDFQMADVGGQMTLMSKRAIRHAQQWGDASILTSNLGKLVGGDVGDILQKNAGILATDPKRADQAWSAIVNRTSDIALLSGIDAGKLKTIAESSPMWASAVASNLDSQVASAKERGDSKSVAAGSKVLDILNNASGREAGGGDSVTLRGQLDLVGNALQLVGTMNQGKK